VSVPTGEGSAATSPGWAWDPSLYAGSAQFYPLGRVGDPDRLVDELVDALGLDGTELLLDIGCGPGSLTLLLAPMSQKPSVSTPTCSWKLTAEPTRRAWPT